jgi:hypothetical protein
MSSRPTPGLKVLACPGFKKKAKAKKNNVTAAEMLQPKEPAFSPARKKRKPVSSMSSEWSKKKQRRCMIAQGATYQRLVAQGANFDTMIIQFAKFEELKAAIGELKYEWTVRIAELKGQKKIVSDKLKDMLSVSSAGLNEKFKARLAELEMEKVRIINERDDVLAYMNTTFQSRLADKDSDEDDSDGEDN